MGHCVILLLRGYGNSLWELDVKSRMIIDFEQGGSRYIIWTSVWMGLRIVAELYCGIILCDRFVCFGFVVCDGFLALC